MAKKAGGKLQTKASSERQHGRNRMLTAKWKVKNGKVDLAIPRSTKIQMAGGVL